MSIKNTGRFEEGERNRQKALNFIIAHPGCTGPQVTAYMGGDKATNSTRLTRMAEDGDVSREGPVQYSYRNSEGRLCNVSTYVYNALRTKTKPAEKMRAAMAENVQGTKRAQAINMMQEEVGPGIFRNIDPDRKPIPNQGGQGNLRRVIGIQASAGMA